MMLKFGKNGTRFIFFMYNSRTISAYTTSTSVTNTSNSTPMVNYLITSLGFTEKEAIFTLSKIRSLKSAENPHFVVNVLTNSGFNKTQVKKMVYYLPRILSFNVDKTLKPKLKAFQDLGLTGSALADVLCRWPHVLRRSLCGHIIPTLEVLKSVFGDNSGANTNLFLVRALKTSSWMLGYGVSKNLPISFGLLRSYGLSVEQIQLLFLRRTKYILVNTEWLQSVLIRVEEKIGIPRNSGMFFHGICSQCGLSEESFESKFKLLKSLGWSESDILTLARTNPYTLSCSESILRSRLSVLMKELGYQPAEIARRACVLTYSFDKRVLPRYSVVKVLKEKGLLKPKISFLSCLYASELSFFKRFVLPFKDELPHLYDDYIRRTNFPTKDAM